MLELSAKLKYLLIMKDQMEQASNRYDQMANITETTKAEQKS